MSENYVGLFKPRASSQSVTFLRPHILILIGILCPYLCMADSGQPKNLQEKINSTRELRALMQSDPHRPIYHFVAPEGNAVPFDPNGALYWKGKYHLGYVYQKFIGGDKQFVWGHAVSTDLLHWTMYPDMLDIKDGDLEKHIYSGGTFLSRDGVPHVIYHSPEGNMLASATDDDLKVWKKFSGNPVLKMADPNPLDPLDLFIASKGKYSVFDAEAWYDTNSDSYYQMTGGLKPGLFKSKDMHQWEYLGPVISGPDTMRYPFEDASCPKFFSLGEKFMHLSISHTLGAQYYIGTFANEKFTPEHHGRMNWPGGTFFAPEQLHDDKGRNIIWGWVIQPRSPELQDYYHNWSPTIQPQQLRDYGWSGVMSLPRVVSLSRKGTLQINPPEEIQAVRLNEVREDGVVLQPNTETTLKARGKSIEVKLEVAGGVRSPFGVKVFASPDGREETVIRYEPDRDQLIIDFARSSVRGPVSIPFFIFDPERLFGSSFDPATYDFSKEFSRPFSKMVSDQRAPLHLEKGETLKLDIFLDRSIIEVFANGRQVVTQIVYPELATSTGVKVFSGKEAVTVKNIQSWTMAETNAY